MFDPLKAGAFVTYPPEVASNLEFFTARNLWHVVSQNPEVRSCADAAQRRNRLGHEGIPLFDELKTGVGVCETPTGSRYVAAHCRGHQRLDESKLRTLFGGPFRRLTDEELLTNFGAERGLVNPFAIFRKSQVQQVFDETIMRPYFPPNTMMTNLGDLCYAIEFNAPEIIAALDGAWVADIVEEKSRRLPTVRTLGILTGNGPESGMLLWERINARIRTHPSKIFRGDFSFPAVSVESLPGMGLSMELAKREAAVRPVVLDGVRKLCEGGANVVGIACNTTQYFADDAERTCEDYGAQFVRTADETARYLGQEGIDTFDFLGIGAVADFKTWSGFGRALSGFNVKTPSEASLSKISELAYAVKKEVVTARTINRLRDLVHQATQTNVVVLALTELSIVFDNQQGKHKSGKRFVDTLDILATRMAEIYIEEYISTLQTSGDEQDVLAATLS